MTFEGVPWFVDNGTHSPEVARVLAYAASGGNEGVIGAADLKVTASAIPDSNIHVAPGAVAMLNQFAGGGAQSYIARNVGDTVKAMTPQGSSGVRYDLVAVIVEDPEYAGQPSPADLDNGPYVRIAVYEDVPSTTLMLAEVDADQTGFALALVKFDVSDGTVTDSDITDMRRMLFARAKTVTRMVSLTSGSTAVPTGSLGVFPPGASWSVQIPAWANRVQLSAVVAGVTMTDSGADGGTASGTARVELGTLSSAAGSWKENAVGPGKKTTAAWMAAQDSIDVPDDMRGTTQTLKAMAQGTSTGMDVAAKQGTTAIVTAVFSEEVA